MMVTLMIMAVRPLQEARKIKLTTMAVLYITIMQHFWSELCQIRLIINVGWTVFLMMLMAVMITVNMKSWR